MTTATRPRVLLIAEAANPEWVSVPLVGWSVAAALREVADVHLVTQVRNRDAIRRTGLTEGEDFTAIDSESVAAPMHRLGERLRMGSGKGWTTVSAIESLVYPYFERQMWKQFGARVAAGEWDVVHRVTPLSPTTPSSIASKCRAVGVPFVLGPLNGGVPWPPGFGTERRREREWLSYVRGVYKANPGRWRTYSASSAIIAGSHHTASEIPKRFSEKVFWIPENGIDPTKFTRHGGPQRSDGPIRVCFVGRLVPYKGPDMVLDAAEGLLRRGAMHLDVVGGGPMREALQATVRDRGLDHAVTFHGQLAHEAVAPVMTACHLLAFPSIREFGGGVVLEAMALGVPPLVVDYAGPGELVTATTGVKVPLVERPALVESLRRQLESAVDQPQRLAQLGAAARDRALGAFTWAAKAEQLCQVYEWVMNPRTVKPTPIRWD